MGKIKYVLRVGGGGNKALMKREKGPRDGYQKRVDVHNSSQIIS